MQIGHVPLYVPLGPAQAPATPSEVHSARAVEFRRQAEDQPEQDATYTPGGQHQDGKPEDHPTPLDESSELGASVAMDSEADLTAESADGHISFFA